MFYWIQRALTPERQRKLLEALATLNIIFLFASGGAIWAVVNLSHQNKQRIADIQESRVDSCVSTYEGINNAFRPFFTPPKARTKKQQKDIDKFNSNILKLEMKCREQTKPKKGDK